MYIIYLAIHSLVLLIIGQFWDFAPIPMYGENEKNRVIPIYIGSTTVLPDIYIYISSCNMKPYNVMGK